MKRPQKNVSLSIAFFAGMYIMRPFTLILLAIRSTSARCGAARSAKFMERRRWRNTSPVMPVRLR